MLERDIAEHFHKNEWTWKLKDGKVIIPSETDVLDALDRAAALLYDSEVGTRLEVGRLIVEKTTTGHDVYVMFGSYT